MRERLTETGQKEQYPAGESAGCLGGQDVDQLERISEPPQEDDGAGELDEAQEIGGVVLVPGDESTRPHHPGEEALDPGPPPPDPPVSTTIRVPKPKVIVKIDGGRP